MRNSLGGHRRGGSRESAASVATSEDVQAPADGEKEEEKEPVKAFALKLLAEKYGIEEEDFLSAEIEVACWTRPRPGISTAHGDRLRAGRSRVRLHVVGAALRLPRRDAGEDGRACWWTREEIGSGRNRQWRRSSSENAMAEIMELAGEGGLPPLRCALAAPSMLSSDVSAGFDRPPTPAFEAKNSAFGARPGASTSTRAAAARGSSTMRNAEYVAAHPPRHG